MKTKIALTLTLSHPMGEGTAVGYLPFYQIIQPAFALDSPDDWERFSLAHRMGEGRGEGFVKTNQTIP